MELLVWKVSPGAQQVNFSWGSGSASWIGHSGFGLENGLAIVKGEEWKVEAVGRFAWQRPG